MHCQTDLGSEEPFETLNQRTTTPKNEYDIATGAKACPETDKNRKVVDIGHLLREQPRGLEIKLIYIEVLALVSVILYQFRPETF